MPRDCTANGFKPALHFVQHGRSHFSGMSWAVLVLSRVLNDRRYDQGVLGGLIALPNFLESNNMNPDDANLQGTVVAIYSVGCFTGCLIMAFIGKMLGRRMFIVIGGALIIIGGSLQAGAHGVEYLIAGRVIAGIGMGRCRNGIGFASGD